MSVSLMFSNFHPKNQHNDLCFHSYKKIHHFRKIATLVKHFLNDIKNHPKVWNNNWYVCLKSKKWLKKLEIKCFLMVITSFEKMKVPFISSFLLFLLKLSISHNHLQTLFNVFFLIASKHVACYFCAPLHRLFVLYFMSVCQTPSFSASSCMHFA